MRRILIVIEELGDPRHLVTRVISPMLLDEAVNPGAILLREYKRAKLQMDVQIENTRAAGPKGPLP